MRGGEPQLRVKEDDRNVNWLKGEASARQGSPRVYVKVVTLGANAQYTEHPQVDVARSS